MPKRPCGQAVWWRPDKPSDLDHYEVARETLPVPPPACMSPRVPLALFLLTAPALANVSPQLAPDPPHAGPPTAAVCSTGPHRCHVHVVVSATGALHGDAAPRGLTPTDLQSAYQIGTAIAGTPTVA